MKILEIAFTLFLVFWISDIAFTQNARRNGTTTRPASRRGTQRIIPTKRTRNPSIPTSTSSSASTSTTTTTSTTTSTTTTPASATTRTASSTVTSTPEPIPSTFESLSPTELSVTITSEGNFSTLKSPSSTKPTLTAVLVMIVEMRANESLIDQIENATLNISSKENERFGSGASFVGPKSARPPHPASAADSTRHETSIDLSNDLTGHESRPPPEFKYVNASKTPAGVADDKCWMDGGIVCKESRLMCTGFGDIDCRAVGQCNTSPTLICNMDLAAAKCTGYGSCKKLPASGEITATSSLSAMATTIVVCTITMGVLVLAGTTIYVYLSTAKHKIRPEPESRSNSNGSSRMDMMNRLGCLGANVYHQ